MHTYFTIDDNLRQLRRFSPLLSPSSCLSWQRTPTIHSCIQRMKLKHSIWTRVSAEHCMKCDQKERPANCALTIIVCCDCLHQMAQVFHQNRADRLLVNSELIHFSSEPPPFKILQHPWRDTTAHLERQCGALLNVLPGSAYQDSQCDIGYFPSW